MRLLPYIAFFLFCGVVSAQPTNVTIIVTTNNFFDLNPSRDAISAVAGNIRLRHTVTDGVDGYDVSTGLPISMTIVSREDGWTNAVVNTATNDGIGVVWWVLPPLGAGSYRLQSDLVIPGDQFPIYDRFLTVTSQSSSATVNLFVTNNISADVILTNDITVNATSQVSVTSIQTNLVTVNTYITNITQSTVYTSGVSSISLTGAVDGAITFAGSGVTQTGNVFNFSGGSGSGNITIQGVTTNVFDFVGQFPVTVSNIGNTIYFGQLGGGGTFIPAGTSNQVFNFVSATNQSFTIPAGVTQIYAYAWGAGGGGGGTAAGGAGGYSFGQFSVTNSEVLTVQIGQGGFVSLTTVVTSAANTLNPWPNGGFGASRGANRAGAGGGSTSILRGTNYLVISGAGGGGSHSVVGGVGGGDSGSAGSLQSGATAGAGGGGGTQSAGGSTGSTAIQLSITNTAGSFYLGGNGGVVTNQNAASAGGGGGGLYGGGGALSGFQVNGNASGGGGSGYINLSQGVLGITVRGASSTPPAQDDPLYGSPSSATWGVGGAANSAGSNGGLILRWVAP